MNKSLCCLALCLLYCLSAFASPLFARQVSSASLLGEAHDETAAVIAGVKITARNEATGFSRTTLSAADGSYRIDDLLPGRYTVSAEKPGFRTLQTDSFVLEVNQKAKLDLELKVGQAAESVTITAEVSLLERRSFGRLSPGFSNHPRPAAG